MLVSIRSSNILVNEKKSRNARTRWFSCFPSSLCGWVSSRCAAFCFPVLLAVCRQLFVVRRCSLSLASYQCFLLPSSFKTVKMTCRNSSLGCSVSSHYTLPTKPFATRSCTSQADLRTSSTNISLKNRRRRILRAKRGASWPQMQTISCTVMDCSFSSQ